MISTIAVIAPGEMGAAVGRRLSEHGARVLTSLTGRSVATVLRAEAANMIGCDDDAIEQADVILRASACRSARFGEAFRTPTVACQRANAVEFHNGRALAREGLPHTSWKAAFRDTAELPHQGDFIVRARCGYRRPAALHHARRISSAATGLSCWQTTTSTKLSIAKRKEPQPELDRIMLPVCAGAFVELAEHLAMLRHGRRAALGS